MSHRHKNAAGAAGAPHVAVVPKHPGDNDARKKKKCDAKRSTAQGRGAKTRVKEDSDSAMDVGGSDDPDVDDAANRFADMHLNAFGLGRAEASRASTGGTGAYLAHGSKICQALTIDQAPRSRPYTCS